MTSKQCILSTIAAVLVMNVCAFAAPVTWIGTSGNWQDGSNWSNGSAPGPMDDAMIDTLTPVTVTYIGTNTIRSLTSTEDLQLVGGALTVQAASTITGPFRIDGTALAAMGGELVASGASTSTNGLFTASLNGKVQLDGLTSYAANASSQSIDWTADGAGSLLNLSKLNSIVMDGNQPFGRFHVLANNGGRVDLSPSSMLNVGLFVSTTGSINASNVVSGRNNWLAAKSGSPTRSRFRIKPPSRETVR